jgi:hypothetical protein
MIKTKFVAVREGDDIVIRMSFEHIEESLADVEKESSLTHPVTVTDKDRFLDRLVANINSSNGVESMMTCEVGEMVERRDRSVEEHVFKRRRAA